MAAVSTLQAPRRKKMVYGKGSRTTFSTAGFFDEEDELAAGAPTIQRQSKVKETYTVQKMEVRSHAPKPVRARAKKVDLFDVPSSEDEVETERPVRPLPKYKPTLVDDTGEVEKLAPWERRHVAGEANAHISESKKRKSPGASPEAQLRRELLRATKSPEASHVSTASRDSPARQSSSPWLSSPRPAPGPTTISAAARLAARRRLADSAAPSDTVEEAATGLRVAQTASNNAGHREASPRKRARTESRELKADHDIEMLDAGTLSSPETMPQQGSDVNTGSPDIYAFPDDSADELRSPRDATRRQKHAKPRPRRSKVTTYSRATPRKGVSAPARLAEMIATDTDITEPPTRSPSITRSPVSSPKQLSTPPSDRMESPETVRNVGTVTPNQRNLWSRLLPSDPVVPLLSTLPIKDLSISSSRRTATSATARRLSKSQSDVPTRRPRLVDRLKASAPEPDEDGSSEDNRSTDDMDVVAPMKTEIQSKAEQRSKLQRNTSTGQSQSQGVLRATSGPKVTYSRVRSYLPEDDLAADLMLGLDEESSQPASYLSRGASQSQKSAYDTEDSEDEDGQGKMRSVHELRASGKNARGMGDIEELLEDTEKTDMAQRGTRRTALITLAIKMMDKAFATRFCAHSCETRLIAQCSAKADDMTGFVLAVTIALLLAAEPPEHAVRALRDADITTWLAQPLGRHSDTKDLMRDRRNLGWKPHQKTLLELAEKLRLNATFWDEQVPAIVTPHLVALKSLDLLVRALRRLGDRDEVLNHGRIGTILNQGADTNGPAQPLELALSVSLLESLSTTATALDWPAGIVEAIASLIPQLDRSSKLQRHTLFLALRLCLNLTDDHATNCDILSNTNDGAFVLYLLDSMKRGFGDVIIAEDAEQKVIALDLLVLATGITINLTEHSSSARTHAISNPDLLSSLLAIFQRGQKTMLDAESEEESIANVTYGYLAVMLANLCQDPAARTMIAGKLPGGSPAMLVEAVEEFVRHHQKVDMLNFEGEEGKEVWGGFTEKLKGVLGRLREVC